MGLNQMSKTYYKVTNQNLMSAFVYDTKLCTQYKIGEFVSSPIPETPLCVFRDYEKALTYIVTSFPTHYKNPFKIFECKIKNKYKNLWLPPSCNPESDQFKIMLKLIKSKKKFLHTTALILNTNMICCKEVKLTKYLCDIHHSHQER
jgi:hypothetical protein